MLKARCASNFAIQRLLALVMAADWFACLSHLPRPARPLKVALPCVGLGNCCMVFKAMDVECSAHNVYDLCDSYRNYLHFMYPQATLHLGREDGDLMAVPLANLDLPIDVMMVGPPCPPWASIGQRQAEADMRAHVFHRMLQWSVHFIKSGGLLVLLLENVQGTMMHLNGQEPFMEVVKRRLQDVVPEFDFDIRTACSEDYMMPQSRVRVYLRGIRKSFAPSGIPAPLEPFGKADLKRFLMPAPNSKMADLTHSQRYNLRRQELQVCSLMGPHFQ